MKKQLPLVLGLASLLTLTGSGLARFGKDQTLPAVAFEELRLHLEIDLPPGFAGGSGAWLTPAALSELQAELVLEAAVPGGGCVDLRMQDLAGKTLFALEGPGRGTLGISELALECAGATLGDTLRAFPPGDYRVEATTVDGAWVKGRVTLRDGLPGLFAVVEPQPGELVLPEAATLTWTPARGAARYLLEIEQPELDFKLETTLPPWQLSFTLPAALLQPGRAYEYSLAVQGDTDNELELEGTFLTAPLTGGNEGSTTR
jgi:hypothetical protein